MDIRKAKDNNNIYEWNCNLIMFLLNSIILIDKTNKTSDFER